VAGKLTLQNDYQLRGYSLSARRPVAVLDLSYEHPSGLYVNESTIGLLEHDGDPALLGVVGNVGYARRMGPEVSIDGGVTRSEYYQRYGVRESAGYTEVYLGFIAHRIASHLYYSPDYFYSGVSTLYGEVEGAVEPVPKLHLSTHVGLLSYVAMPAGYSRPSNQYDWRVGLSREFGVFDLHAAVSGGGPGDDYYGGGRHGKTAFVVGGGWTF